MIIVIKSRIIVIGEFLLSHSPNCVYILCILCVYRVYIMCISCVYCVYIVCISCVCCVYVVCMLCVCCVYIVCCVIDQFKVVDTNWTRCHDHFRAC